MKKVLAFVICVVLTITLCSCQSKSERWQEQYDLGMQYLEAGDYAQAIEAFTAAQEMDPRQPSIYLARGDALMGIANSEDAIKDYQKAIELRPDADTFLRLANAFLSQNDVNSAIATLQTGYEKTKDPALLGYAADLEHASVLQGSIFAWGENYLDMPVADAVIFLRDPGTSEMNLCSRSDANGSYQCTVTAGEYELYICAEGYYAVSFSVTIGQDEALSVGNVYLLSQGEAGGGTLSCTVQDANTGEPIEGAQVRVTPSRTLCGRESQPTEDILTDWGNGSYANINQPIGYYTISVSCEGYSSASADVVVGSRYSENQEILLYPQHVHIWTEANYQEPSTCRECGRTQGEPLTPYFVEHGVKANLQVGKSYDYEALKYDNDSGQVLYNPDGTPQRIVGTFRVLSYEILEADETHAARDGYEWRIATFEVTMPTGYAFARLETDYYSGKINGTVKYSDDKAVEATYTVQYNGEEVDCVLRNEPLYDRWEIRNQQKLACLSWRSSVQVPIGYDGYVQGVYDYDIALRTGEKSSGLKDIIDEYNEEDFLLFRFANIEE